MQKQQTIKCAFCKGIGKHPHFGSTCPVCKGKGKNTVVGPFMTCCDCCGSGQKRGTTLTCYTCGGLGVLPDTREIVAKARKEIEEAREEIEKEKEEFREKPLKVETKRLRKRPSETKEETRLSNAGRKKREAVENAIASYCNDCALGEGRECWDIECALAPYSPVAGTRSH